MTVSQAVVKWGISGQRIRLLCVQGRIEGAKFINGPVGGYWWIPDDARQPDRRPPGRPRKARA